MLHPYLGISLNTFGDADQLGLDIGFGIESGIRYKIFYLGAEYGIYGIVLYNPPNTALRPPGYIPPDELQNVERYYGIHAGIVVKNQFWFGIVFLWSTATVSHFIIDTTHYLTSSEYQHTWFNVGPDFRINASDHLMMDFAYTIRRGLKLGLVYIFL